MFDQAILFIDDYFLWLALLVGAFKLLLLLLYKGFQPKYIFFTYFTIFSGVQMSVYRGADSRLRFRQLHNVLTVAFYLFFGWWLVVYITVRGL